MILFNTFFLIRSTVWKKYYGKKRKKFMWKRVMKKNRDREREEGERRERERERERER